LSLHAKHSLFIARTDFAQCHCAECNEITVSISVGRSKDNQGTLCTSTR